MVMSDDTRWFQPSREVIDVLEDDPSEEVLSGIVSQGMQYDPTTREVYFEESGAQAPAAPPAASAEVPAYDAPAASVSEEIPSPLLNYDRLYTETPEPASPDIEDATEDVSLDWAFQEPYYDQAIAAGASPEEIEENARDGFIYHPLYEGFAPREYTEIGDDNYPALKAGATLEEIRDNASDGFKYSDAWGGFVPQELVDYTPEEYEDMQKAYDQRPDEDALKKMVYLSMHGGEKVLEKGYGVHEGTLPEWMWEVGGFSSPSEKVSDKDWSDLDEAGEEYFEKHRGEWSKISLSQSTLQDAIGRAKEKLAMLKSKRKELAKSDAELEPYKRIVASIGDETTMAGDPEDVLEAEVGQRMQALAKAELAQMYLIEQYQIAMNVGVQSPGKMSMEEMKDLYGWRQANEMARGLTLEGLSEAQAGIIEKAGADKTWGEIAEDIPKMPANLLKGGVEFAGFFVLMGKETVVDLPKAVLKLGYSALEDVGERVFYEGDGDWSNTSQAAEEGWRDVEDIYKGLWMGGTGLVTGVGMAGDVLHGMASGEEEAYKTFANWVVQRPADVAMMGAAGVGVAKAASGAALVGAMRNASVSAAKYRALAGSMASRAKAPFIRPAPSAAATEAQTGAMIGRAARTAGKETAEVIGEGGIPVQQVVSPQGILEPVAPSISQIFNRGVSVESLTEAVKAADKLPADPALREAFINATADRLKVEALRTKYKTLAAWQKNMDPISYGLGLAAKSLSPGIVRWFRRRDSQLEDLKIVTADGTETAVFDVIAKFDSELADQWAHVRATAQTIPEELARKVDDVLRQSDEFAGVDAWVILPDGTEWMLPPAVAEPELSSIFGRTVDAAEKELLVNRPEVVHQKIRENSAQARKSVDAVIKDRVKAGQELGLLESESAHFFSMLDYADYLRQFESLPQTLASMKQADKNALAKSFSTRRARSARRKEARKWLEDLLEKPEGLHGQDVILLSSILDELSTVSHEWGARRGRGMLDVAKADMAAARQSIETKLAGLGSGQRLNMATRQIQKILDADAAILDIDAHAVGVLDDFYRNEFLLDPDSSILGRSADDLRGVLEGMLLSQKVSGSAAGMIADAINVYESQSKLVEAAARNTKGRKRQRKKTLSKAKTRREKAAAKAREELEVGSQQASTAIDDLVGQARQEMVLVRNEILEALTQLSKRNDALKTIRQTRAGREASAQVLKKAMATGGDGSLMEMGRMMAAGIAPKAVPAKHIALAEAVGVVNELLENSDVVSKLLDEGQSLPDALRAADEHAAATVAHAMKQNGLDVAAALSLGDDVQSYLRFVSQNYSTPALKNAVAVYSVDPLHIGEKVDVVQLRNAAQRPVSQRLDVEAMLAEMYERAAGGAKPPGGAAKMLERYQKLKDEGKAIPKDLEDAVRRMSVTLAGDLRTEMFRAMAAAIDEGLLSERVGRMRIATYFPDLYRQYETFMGVKGTRAPSGAAAAEALDLGDVRFLNSEGMNNYQVEGNNFRRAKYKDRSLKEKREMGLIDDAAVTFVTGLNRIYNDILTAKMFKDLRNAKFADDYAIPELRGKSLALDADTISQMSKSTQAMFRQIPGKDAYLKGGVFKRRLQQKYGELSGMYIPEEVFDDIINTADSSNKAAYYWNKLLRGWKMGQTVYNPVTQMRNHVSNHFIMDMQNMWYGEGNARSIIFDPDIWRQASTHTGKWAEEAMANGLFGTDMVAAEMQGVRGGRNGLPKDFAKRLREASREQPIGSAMLLADLFAKAKAAPGRFSEIAQHSYRLGDEAYKLIRYVQIRKLQAEFLKTGNLTKGMRKALGGTQEALDILSIADPALAKRAAVQRVFKDGFVDYSRTSKAVNWARKGWAPFITFTAEMLPKFLENQARNPIKALAYREMFRSMNEYTRLIDGEPTLGDFEDMALAYEELPKYAKFGSVPFGTKMVPTADGDIPMYAWGDIALWTPMAGVLHPTDELDGSGFKLSVLPDFMQLSNPLITTPLKIMFNRGDHNNHHGQLYPVGTGVDSWDQIEPSLALMRRTLLPPLFGGRSWDKLQSAIEGRPYGARGKAYTVNTALWDIVGGRTTDIDKNSITQRRRAWEIKKNKTPQTRAAKNKKKYFRAEWEKDVQRANEKTMAAFDKVEARARLRARELFTRATKRRELMKEIIRVVEAARGSVMDSVEQSEDPLLPRKQ